LLDRALVLDEKQLPHREFIEMQIRANLVVHIHQGGHKAIASAGKFTRLLQNSPRNHFAILPTAFQAVGRKLYRVVLELERL
jgi:hypothetical protein